MKKFALIIALLVSFVNVYSQDYLTIDFSSNLSDFEGIIIENINTNSTIIVDENDILQLILNSTYIKDNENLKDKLTVYPNPIKTECFIEFYNFQNGPVEAAILTQEGKTVYRNTFDLSTGNHQFRLSGLASGVFTINIKTLTNEYSSVCISANTNACSVSCSYVGIISNNKKLVLESNYKSEHTRNTVEMEYNFGDELRFIGVSTEFTNDTIFLSPVNDNTVSFNFINPFACGFSFTDIRDGKYYQTIQIGSQCWMQENLGYLPEVNSNSEWQSLGTDIHPAYGVYGYNGNDLTTAMNLEEYSTYGVIYNWLATMNGESSSNTNPSNVKGICPQGWHLPSNSEWIQLDSYLGGYTVAGGKMKSVTGWHTPNTGATNSSLFTGLPGGLRDSNGQFYYDSLLGMWWSSTEFDVPPHAYIKKLNYDSAEIGTDAISINQGASVRCIKD